MNDLTEVMSAPLLIPQAPEGEQERVEAIFNGIEAHIGFIPDGLKLYSFSPPLLESFVGNISYFNGQTSLAPSLMAMIRYHVSWQAECQFCIDMNEGFLANMGIDLDEVRASRDNPEKSPLGKNEIVLLSLALKSVNTPEEVNAEDMESARTAGWSDREIFDAVAQAASNRAFNTVLRTFKIEHQGVLA